MKSQTAWDFAQSYGARVMLRVGIMLLLLSLGYYLVLVFEISDPANWGVLFYAVTQLVAFCVACILPVERALKRNFDKYGNRAVNAK
jgi:hypothetical protein